MKFGKLADVSQVDFSLPAEPTTNTSILAELVPRQCNFYIGCTGWSMPQWKGTYYPEKAAAKDFLQHYSRQFNTIEFNTTHYNIPKVDTVQRWYRESADDFIFCPKVFKFVSHTKSLGLDGDNITLMLDNLSYLHEKLGPFFMQLPPYFAADRLDQLEAFYQAWPEGVDLALELRHESWYSDPELLDHLQLMTASYGHTLVITDVAGRRDIVHMRLCGDYLMVRWVGNSPYHSGSSLHPTDRPRIDEWSARILHYIEQGLQKVYFFAHEPDNILAPDIAAYICKLVSAHPMVNTRGPQLLKGDDPQLTLF